MRRALELAERSVGETSPNPMVGCVIVRDGQVVGEGYHKKPGLPHAEVEALRQAGSEARGADLYVNLEPCCHYGRTPPCTEAIIEGAIRRVVAATGDPNPKVAGGGFAALSRAGIEVEVGLLEDEARALNEAYFHRLRYGRPFVTLKWAMTLDGKVAGPGGETARLSGEEALWRVHEERRRHDAIMVGIGTVLTDDPELTVRHVPGRSPRRIVVDARLETPPSARVLSAGVPTLILTTEDADQDRARHLEERGASVLRLPASAGRVDIGKALSLLADDGVSTLLVEGGPTLHGTFVDLGLADRLLVDVASRVIGAKDAPSAVMGDGAGRGQLARGFTIVRVDELEGDVVIEARPRGGEAPVHRHRKDEGPAVGTLTDTDGG